MSPDNLSQLKTQFREFNSLSTLKKPTIKILLYTDAPTQIVEEPVGRFGLGRMIEQLKAHAPAFADVSVKWVGRYPPGKTTADNKINVVMDNEVKQTKEPFDEIWFFGGHQINKASLSLRIGGGGPESELDESEVDSLKTWMNDGGGVLVTGDHANLRPSDADDQDPNPRCPDKFRQARYLSLGRALGRCIPRAGLMRDWEGPPTSREKDSNNTQVITAGDFETFDEQIFFQRDPIPQQLILATFDEFGAPSVDGQPHPLFFYRPGHLIQLFPDHLHEGEVTVSKGRHTDVWPTGTCKPMPQIVAFGTDKRNGKRIKILAAYDGDAGNVGRIVADSSWHHYFNINLARFDHPAALDSASDQIGQFYGNLALWLCPARKRFEMASAMASSLADDPMIHELGSTPNDDKTVKRKVGILAHRHLSTLCSPCEVHELLNITVPDIPRYFSSSTSISLPEEGSAQVFLPSKQSLLASIINQYPQELIESDESNLSNETRVRIQKAFALAWNEAWADQQQYSGQILKAKERFVAEAERKSSMSINKNSG